MKSISIVTIFYLFFLSCNTFQSNSLNQTEPKQASKTIIVYGSDTCHYCIDTKKFLEENKIAFKFYDIDRNDEALKEMLNKLTKAKIDVSDLKIPVIDKNGELFMNDGDFDDFLKKLKD
ncbi:glutaredoxin family protein [Olleya sp. R77988]|uniref:glutaredoxin family protein n=1 Tax=Olleya sp. R77988 TaxID=3093875 RepID=UPI0037CB1D3B